MIEAPGLRDATRLEYALHEGVHLYADPVVPAAGACPRVCVGTFQRTYGTGFGEGATQAITEAIMDAQGIAKYYRDRPYEIYTRPMRKLMAYFRSMCSLARISSERPRPSRPRWSIAGARTGCRLPATRTSKSRTRQMAEIDKLEAAHFKRLHQRGPKGDFPMPPRYSNVA